MNSLVPEYEQIRLDGKEKMVIGLRHHGAREGVTGSCHQLLLDGKKSLLIDCGLFQGAETVEEAGTDADPHHIDFPVADIVALVVTHVHIDHVGRIPWLLAAGYTGPIICSEPSAELLPLVLEDAFRLAVTGRQDVVENYLKMVKARMVPLAYKSTYTLLDSDQRQVCIRLQRAGHILGSAYVECDLVDKKSRAAKRLVFSGDLGAPWAPLLPAPQPPYRADLLVLESTYGDRLHEDRRTRRQRLEAVLAQAMRDGGTVLIPAFSIGRTQEILYELEEIFYRKRGKERAVRLSPSPPNFRLSSIRRWPAGSPRYTAISSPGGTRRPSTSWLAAATPWPLPVCGRSTATRPTCGWWRTWLGPAGRRWSWPAAACAPAGGSSTT
jgi:metallo-beta-lactamase family protein